MATAPHRCHSCGAPAPSVDGSAKCHYCGVPLAGPGPTATPSSTPRATPILPLMFGVLVAGGAGAASFMAQRRATEVAAAAEEAAVQAGLGPSGAPIESPTGLVTAVPGAGGDDLLVYFSQDSRDHLGRIRGATLERAWKTEVALKNANQAQTVVAGDVVYVAGDERLRAFDLETGATRWDVGLVSDPNCDGCMRVMGDRVVVRQKDGTLQGFDAGTGAVVWSQRNPDGLRTLPVVGESIVAAAPGEAERFVLLDPKTGTADEPHEVRCGGKIWKTSLSSQQRITPTPDGKGVIFALATVELCLVRWDLATRKVAWTHWAKDRHSLSWYEEGAYLVDASGVYLAGDEVIAVVDLETGKERDLVREKDATFLVRGIHEGVLLALHTPGWDSSKHTLWALGIPDGAQKWQYKLTGRDPLREFAGGPVAGGFVFAQPSEDEKAVIVERVDLKTGASVFRTLVGKDERSTPNLWGQAWSPGRVWLRASVHFVTVDLATGAATAAP